MGTLIIDSGEKVVVSEFASTLPYGRAATSIYKLRSTVAVPLGGTRTWRFFSGIDY